MASGGGAQSAPPPAPAEGPPPLNFFVSADGSTRFPAASGRYHLYISLGCPWASRCYAVLKLKGLDDVIGVTLLWDKVRKTIVNNESADIMRMLNSEFDAFATDKGLNLYPADLRPAIDNVNAWVLRGINSGVYRCGNAKEQGVYDAAFNEVFSALDRCEEILSKQRYLVGPTLTEADIRLFVSLVRFDEVYFIIFKCNQQLIREYTNLFNYLKDIYQAGGMAATVDMWHIKQYHYISHPEKNPSGVVPAGFPMDYSAPHDRARLDASGKL